MKEYLELIKLNKYGFNRKGRIISESSIIIWLVILIFNREIAMFYMFAAICIINGYSTIEYNRESLLSSGLISTSSKRKRLGVNIGSIYCIIFNILAYSVIAIAEIIKSASISEYKNEPSNLIIYAIVIAIYLNGSNLRRKESDAKWAIFEMIYFVFMLALVIILCLGYTVFEWNMTIPGVNDIWTAVGIGFAVIIIGCGLSCYRRKISYIKDYKNDFYDEYNIEKK